MEGKKISFGFMKTKKAEKLPVPEKKDFIECVEEKSIKVVGGDEVKEIAPLIIPMKPNTLITTERLKEIAEKVESALEEPETADEPLKPQATAPENETLEQMAVRELLEDSKKAVKVDTPQLTLLLPVKSMASGEKESTLDDYESVPVQEFGLAMLRGMGWTKNNEKSTFKPPQLRPKGLGLGADKVVKENNKQKLSKNSKDEELTIVKNAYVKITTGKHSGYYGKVMSLDEDNGRVMVDITVKKETVSLSEFMMHPVNKSEFDKESKVINANSFEQYKKNERPSKNSERESSNASESNKKDEKSKYGREGKSSNENNNHRRTENERQSGKDTRERNRDRSNRERYRDSNEEQYSKKNRRDSSHESLSESDSETIKKERKSKKHYSSMESLDSDAEKAKNRERRRRDSDSESYRKYKKGRESRKQSSDSETDRRIGKESEKERKRHDSDSESEQRSKKVKEPKKRDSDSEPERSRNRRENEPHRYDSDSETDHSKSKKSDKERKRHDSDESISRSKRSDTPEGKRDIDKKRKGKKKKRDRDRSPNHRKHRK